MDTVWLDSFETGLAGVVSEWSFVIDLVGYDALKPVLSAMLFEAIANYRCDYVEGSCDSSVQAVNGERQTPVNTWIPVTTRMIGG